MSWDEGASDLPKDPPDLPAKPGFYRLANGDGVLRYLRYDDGLTVDVNAALREFLADKIVLVGPQTTKP